jgi:phosphatidylserine decarboxylase
MATTPNILRLTPTDKSGEWRSNRNMKIGIVIVVILVIFVLILLALYLMNRYVWFYRDPVRAPDETGRVILSAADGQVVYIKKFNDGHVVSEKLGREIELNELTELKVPKDADGWIIGVYMSPFDVHYNFAPTDGTIKGIVYTKPKTNLPMVDLMEYIRFTYLRRAVDNFSEKFHLVNERNSLYMEGPGFDYAVIEIADKFVSKISCFVVEGEQVEAGRKIGFIDRGSQVDLIIFKTNIYIKVKPGQQVYGAKTVIAVY